MTHGLAFNGKLLRRGFWLYAWEVVTQRDTLYYVGRTGDSSSRNAQSPFNRMSEHLGFNVRNNVLRRGLENLGWDPSDCQFRLVAHGSIFEEAATDEQHRDRRDSIAAPEKALADGMDGAGCRVSNPAYCRKPVDETLLIDVRRAFAVDFCKLASTRGSDESH